MGNQKLMINTVREFKVWRAHFLYSPKGKTAVGKMRKLSQGDNEFPIGNLESSVMSACFLASKYLPEQDRFDSRRRIGGIQYPVSAYKGNSRGKPKNVGRNSLILHLSVFFKFYTADESNHDWVGKKIPNFGQGHPDIVATFINAVYKKENISAEAIEKFVRKSQKDGIRLAHWKLQD